jgi:uncharacterized protein
MAGHETVHELDGERPGSRGARWGTYADGRSCSTRRCRRACDLERIAVAAGEPVTLDWRTMASLNYRTGEMSDALRRLNGVQVRVPGFMVPLEDWDEQVTEFILVPYFGACIHTPPPPPNQMAHVLMTRNRRVTVNLWDPVWVVGTLKIESVDSPYGAVGYQLAAEGIRPYEG